MKKLYMLLLLAFFVSQGAFSQVTEETVLPDSINQLDEKRLRQGYWKIYGRMKAFKKYAPDQLIEEGVYVNSRKQGLWKRYFPNGEIKSEIHYKNSIPVGDYKIYYGDGSIQEEGNWQRSRNNGEFKRYYENGNMSQHFNFNEVGRREGVQRYYYENGQLMMEGDWQEGKEAGVLKVYNEDGSLKAEKFFNGGKMDPAKTKIYTEKKEAKEVVKEVIDKEVDKAEIASDDVVKVKKGESVNVGVFDGNGYYKMYNRNKQISKDGMFKNYRLMDGKHYQYDEHGILVRISIIKRGRFLGEAPLPND